ncbi:YbdD/YjiX family protein [Ectobacillus ponti]|uniref:YbdD/YjiX family protein n=1 Tax=Ectobacillus ponti TaxID=2961894 RepID=A0AA41X6E7_9BACI|nr:YbdD/YjiX family protein [Ectobacillus ponti]MCP8968043.1 YbdD/YjiX family protein [Ectobacillus ponti]
MCGTMRNWWSKLLQHRKEFISLLVGVPSYEKYVAHMKERYPNEPILCEKQFFAQAQESRYEAKGGKVSRCC